MTKRICDTEHLRDYPDCLEECEHDKCECICEYKTETENQESKS